MHFRSYFRPIQISNVVILHESHKANKAEFEIWGIAFF